MRRGTSFFARGEPMVWLSGGALVLSVAMIAGLLLLVLHRGMATFWPTEVVRYALEGGVVRMGEPARENESERLVRTGNFDLTGTHFHWVKDSEIEATDHPEWAVVVERFTWGRFYGNVKRFEIDGEATTSDPAQAWEQFGTYHGEVLDRRDRAHALEEDEIGSLSAELEDARLALRGARLAGEETDALQVRYDAMKARVDATVADVRARVREIRDENARYRLILATSDGTEHALELASVSRAYAANRLGLLDKIGIYVSRWWEFLFDDPREANSEGGVYPAIFGTVVMTLLMSIVVVPFGVLAALYLREYARQGFWVSIVRVAVNNLAGVPSVVFGVFGLGFFCYIMGASIDELFFSAKLPNPTYGKGGVMWASLTLALLTLPVVIVATEEALAAVPSSMREGSFACGAGRWQTIRRIVLPRALPGIMTGMILAIARGAGEVAPLMLVGAAKLAPELPIDGSFPYVHPERSFMHLGFHIYDLGFQSQNSEASKPMVFTTTLLLIGIVVLLNVTAIWVRARLRRAYHMD